jgi:hypothetical protein
VPGTAALQIEDAELPALKRRVLAEHLDDAFRIRAFLQLLEHEHLVLVRAVDAGLARGHALAGYNHGLHAHQELVIAVDTRRRRDDDPSRRPIDRDDRPGRQRRRGEEHQCKSSKKRSFHSATSYGEFVLR